MNKNVLKTTILLILLSTILLILCYFTSPVPVKNDICAILSDDYFDWYRNETRTVRYNGGVFTTSTSKQACDAILENPTDLSLISTSVALRWKQEMIDSNVMKNDAVYYFMQTEDESVLILVPHEMRSGILGDAPRPFAFFLVRVQE